MILGALLLDTSICAIVAYITRITVGLACLCLKCTIFTSHGSSSALQALVIYRADSAHCSISGCRRVRLLVAEVAGLALGARLATRAVVAWRAGKTGAGLLVKAVELGWAWCLHSDTLCTAISSCALTGSCASHEIGSVWSWPIVTSQANEASSAGAANDQLAWCVTVVTLSACEASSAAS